MTRRNRYARRVAVAASIAVAAGFLAQPGPSGADVTSVTGSAYGYSLDSNAVADVAPTPAVALPAGGSATPLTASAPTGSAPPPFTSGPITVSTQGTPGPAGSVTSSATISNVAGEFDAATVASSCTANETDIFGTTTITGGTVDIDNGDATHLAATEAVPTAPPVNHVVNGHLHIPGIGTETFQYIFNEQFETANSITVNAVHLKLLGPVVTGDLIIGQSVCAITATGVTTTLPTGVTTTLPTGVTTTLPVGVTTTLPTGVTTTLPVGVTTTLPTGVTTTLPVGVTTTLPTGVTTTTVLGGVIPPLVFGSINVSDLIRQIVCPILQQLAADPFLRPFIQPFLVAFGCTA